MVATWGNFLGCPANLLFSAHSQYSFSVNYVLSIRDTEVNKNTGVTVNVKLVCKLNL